MTQQRLILTEIRRNLPEYQDDLQLLIESSGTLRKLLEDGLGIQLLTPAVIQKIVSEIKNTNNRQRIVEALPIILDALRTDPYFVTPAESEISKQYENYEDIPLYANTLLQSMDGSVFLDPDTGSLVLAPTQNERIDSPEKSQDGYIGELTPDDIEVCAILLEDEIRLAREQQEIFHDINTVSETGGMGLYDITVDDLVDINVVSEAAITDWNNIPENEHENYAELALRYGIIALSVYDKIPYNLRTTLQWYVLSHTEYWLEKTIGPKNFLLYKKVQKLLLYRFLLKEWKTVFRYLVLRSITQKSQIAGYLIAQKILGKRAAQIFGAGGKVSSELGRLGEDIFNRVYKAVESKVGPTTVKELDKASQKIESISPFKPTATRKFKFFPNIANQPSNASLRRVPKNQGFYDPNRIYPRVTHIGEPDTNRLARNHKIKDTIVGIKNDERTLKVPVARKASPVKWDQPKSPYNAKYPYNHVQESESGHVVELDDTPNNERMHWYHREGTFMEIDRNGTMVRKIVGDGYEIWERDGYIYIGGKANITVEGNCNIYVKNNVNLEVDGNLVADVHKNMTFNVAEDFNVSAGGVINLKGKKDVNIQSTKSNINIKSDKKTAISSNNIDVYASKVLKMSGQLKASVAAPKGQALLLSGASTVVVNGLGLSLMPSPAAAAALAKANAGQSADNATNGGAPVVKNPKEPKFVQLYEESKLDEWASALSSLSEVDDPSVNAAEIAILKKRGIDEGLITKEDLDKPLSEGESDNAATPALKPAKVASCSAIYSQTTFSPSYKLTSNISLGMLKGTDNLRNQHGLKIQDIVCNLRQLSENVIEPVFEIIGKNRTFITSTFRTAGQFTGALKAANGVSFHEQGLAIDFGFSLTFAEYYTIASQLRQSIQYDKLILEYRLGQVRGAMTYKPWIHIQWQQQGLNMASGRLGGTPRLSAFTMKNDEVYSPKLINLSPASSLTY